MSSHRQIFIERKFVGGVDQLQRLNESGELDNLLAPVKRRRVSDPAAVTPALHSSSTGIRRRIVPGGSQAVQAPLTRVSALVVPASPPLDEHHGLESPGPDSPRLTHSNPMHDSDHDTAVLRQHYARQRSTSMEALVEQYGACCGCGGACCPKAQCGLP